MSESSELQQKVAQVICESLGVANLAAAELKMGVLPQWDSFAHMQIVLALEDAFEVSIPSYKIADLQDVESISNALTPLLQAAGKA